MATAGDENHLFIDAELDRNTTEMETVSERDTNLNLYDVTVYLIKKKVMNIGKFSSYEMREEAP